MGNVVQLQNGLTDAPFGPRESTPELRAALRKASVKDVRARLADHSRVSAKTWALIGTELIGEQERAKRDGPRVFASLFAKTSDERQDAARYPFSLRTAHRLIAIAQMGLDTVCPNLDALPSSWGTIYELSRLPVSRLSRLIESGAVHPMMTRAEASKLAGSKSPTPKTESRDYSAVKQHFLSIKVPEDRVAAFRKLMRDCHITLKQLQGAM